MTILLLVFKNHSLSVRKIPDHPFENFIKLNDQQIIALTLLPHSIKQIIISPINITNSVILPISCRPLTEHAAGSFHFLFRRILSSLPDSQSSTASPAVFQASTFKYRIWIQLDGLALMEAFIPQKYMGANPLSVSILLTKTFQVLAPATHLQQNDK